MHGDQHNDLPEVPLWRIYGLRFVYLLIAGVMGPFVWYQLMFETEPWPATRIISKSMLASLALFSIIGIKYPLQMLPILLVEVLWKTVAILLVIAPAWYAGRLTPEQLVLLQESVGIFIVYLIVPWRYVWARYIRHPGEPWRRSAI